MSRFVILILFFSFLNCNSVSTEPVSNSNNNTFAKGALLTTSFKSFEDFKKVVAVEYSTTGTSWVQLIHSSNGGQVTSKLYSGVSEGDFIDARDGDFWDRVRLGFESPYFVMQRKNMLGVYILSRRRHKDFGWPDMAFYDLANTMKNNISKEDLAVASSDELSEKGYLNTFNHVAAQSFMTTLFSEELADFVADTHERENMPELMTGKFTPEQLKDIKNGVVDNYVDMINNEWGQELGKRLKLKYNINQDTNWTPELVATYLNEIQSYFSWVFKLRFQPFTAKDELTIKFSNKITRIMNDVSGLR